MKAPTPISRRKSPIRAPSVEPEDWLSPLAAWIVAAALVAAVFALYSPALNFQFILDDHRFVGDPRLQTSGHVWEYFTKYVWAQIPGGPSSFYRPVFVLWLRLNFLLSGTSPWGWHLLSIAKHASVAVLLGLLVWKLLRDRVAALLAAALFALHPAQTESVAWVTVPDPLMSAAVLGSVLLYLEYAERRTAYDSRQPRKSGKKSRRQAKAQSAALWLSASAAVCLAALMTKETAIVLPAALFGLAVLLPPGEPRTAGPKARLYSTLIAMLPFLGVTALYLLLRLKALGGKLSPATQHLPWKTVLLSWPATLWFYVKVMLWPVRSRAFADPTLADDFSVHGVLLPALGVGCVLGLLAWACLLAWRKAGRDLEERRAAGVKRALVLGILFLVLPILLALNLNALDPGDFLHGRYTYLSLAGLMLLLATGWRLAKKQRTVLLSAVGLLAVAFGVLTARQESAWKDDLTVFTMAHQNAPNNAPVARNLMTAHVQMALLQADAGQCDEAVPVFRQAIRQYPQEWFAWAGLGECQYKLNDLAGAEQSLHRASDLSHQPQVKEEWQQVRARMGLPSAPQE